MKNITTKMKMFQECWDGSFVFFEDALTKSKSKQKVLETAKDVLSHWIDQYKGYEEIEKHFSKMRGVIAALNRDIKRLN